MPYPPISPDNGRNFTKTIHHDTYPDIDPKALSGLSGKAVLITGASKGIGKAIAVSFAEAGASHIAIGARSALTETAATIREAAKNANRPEPEILSLKLDVCDRDSIATAAKLVDKTFGRLDILVNNAGYLAEFKPLLEGDEDDWWTNWEINIRGVYWVTKSLLPLILKSDSKTVINMSSIGALNLGAGASGYQTTKFAVLKLTEHLMVDYGDDGILSYAIHPGGVPTDMGQKLPQANHQYLVDKPELAADAITWLTSERREWLAGRYISVCWDMPELISREKEIVEKDLLKMRMKF